MIPWIDIIVTAVTADRSLWHLERFVSQDCEGMEGIAALPVKNGNNGWETWTGNRVKILSIMQTAVCNGWEMAAERGPMFENGRLEIMAVLVATERGLKEMIWEVYILFWGRVANTMRRDKIRIPVVCNRIFHESHGIGFPINCMVLSLTSISLLFRNWL